MSTRARPVRPFCGIRLADHRPKFLGWDEILQAFATAAIGRSLRPVHQGERTSVPLLRRLVAPAKAGRESIWIGLSSGRQQIWRRNCSTSNATTTSIGLMRR